jgi:hypothetical protein
VTLLPRIVHRILLAILRKNPKKFRVDEAIMRLVKSRKQKKQQVNLKDAKKKHVLAAERAF